MQDVGRFVDLTIDFATLFNIDNFIRPYEMVSIVFLFADKDRCVDAVWSAITQVKVLSPEICPVALGQEFLNSEASIATRSNGECVSGVPGSEAMAGHSTVHNGTWDSHIVPDSEASNELKRRRRKYGDMAVGLTQLSYEPPEVALS